MPHCGETSYSIIIRRSLNCFEKEFRLLILVAKRHYEKHGSQYPGIDEQQYLQVARDLLSSEDGDDVISFDSELGFLVKYRRSTNDFAIGRPDGQISTVYKPDNGEQHFVEERLKNGRKT